jgi:hypothetical protein
MKCERMQSIDSFLVLSKKMGGDGVGNGGEVIHEVSISSSVEFEYEVIV